MGMSQTTSSRGHEHRDISFGAVVTFAVALAAALVAIHFVVRAFIVIWRHSLPVIRCRRRLRMRPQCSPAPACW